MQPWLNDKTSTDRMPKIQYEYALNYHRSIIRCFLSLTLSFSLSLCVFIQINEF